MGRRTIAKLVVGALLTLGVVVPTAQPAQGATAIFNCTAGGTVQISNGNAFFSGQGSCLGSNGLFWPMTFFAGGRGFSTLCLGGRAGLGFVVLQRLDAAVILEDPYGAFQKVVWQRWTQLVPGLGAPVYSAGVSVSGGGGGLMNGVSLLTQKCPNPQTATTQGPFSLVFTANNF